VGRVVLGSPYGPRSGEAEATARRCCIGRHATPGGAAPLSRTVLGRGAESLEPSAEQVHSWPVTENESARDKILGEALVLERDSREREIGHRLAAEFWNKVHLGLGLPSVAFAAIAGTAALAEFSILIAGILALAVAVLSALSTWLNPNRTEDLHRNASNEYHSICGRARELQRIDPRSDDEIRHTLFQLLEEFNNRIAASPPLPRRYTRLSEKFRNAMLIFE
jgi:hypothetical protein